MKVDRVKMVESFLQSANHKGDFDPDFERKLTQHRLSSSFEALPVDIWRTGEYANLEVEDHFDYQDELSGKGQGMKRSNSITNVLPPLLTKEDKNKPIKADKTKRESLITSKKSEKEVTL